jgi:protease-4
MTETTPPTSPDRQQNKGGTGSRLRRGLAGLFGENSSSPSGFRRLGSVLLWGVAPLLVGLWLAQSMVPQPAVGVIRLYGDIYLDSADWVLAQIEAARNDPDIAAVVVQMDSPGGEVAASEQLYLELQTLRREMPVVGSIDSMAASGAFYMAMGTDPIYAKPSSTVGNVGVWGYVPPDLGVNDVILASGPFKLTASNRDEFLRSIEAIKQEFVETVFSQRGERITISRVELSQGLAYTGRQAMGLGLIDHLGTETDAIRTAASQAGIANYRVVDLQAQLIAELSEGAYGELEPWVGAADPLTGERILPPGAYLLYDQQLGGAP